MSNIKSWKHPWWCFASIETLLTGTSGYNHLINELIDLGRMGAHEKLRSYFDSANPPTPHPMIKLIANISDALNRRKSGPPYLWETKEIFNWELEVRFRRSIPSHRWGGEPNFGCEILLTPQWIVIPIPFPTRDPDLKEKFEFHVTKNIGNITPYDENIDNPNGIAIPLRATLFTIDFALYVLGQNWDIGNPSDPHLKRLNDFKTNKVYSRGELIEWNHDTLGNQTDVYLNPNIESNKTSIEYIQSADGFLLNLGYKQYVACEGARNEQIYKGLCKIFNPNGPDSCATDKIINSEIHTCALGAGLSTAHEPKWMRHARQRAL